MHCDIGHSWYIAEMAQEAVMGVDAANTDEIDLAGTFTLESETTTTGGTVTLELKDESGDAENGEVVTLAFNNPGGTVHVSNVGGDTLIYDPPAVNSSVSAGHDRFVFHPNLGADTGNAGTPNTDPAHDHFAWAHEEQWSTLAGGAHDSIPADVAAQIDAHWHHALQNAVHLH